MGRGVRLLCAAGQALLSALLVTGCAAGSVREARVGPLGAYPRARGITVEAANPAAGALAACAATLPDFTMALDA